MDTLKSQLTQALKGKKEKIALIKRTGIGIENLFLELRNLSDLTLLHDNLRSNDIKDNRIFNALLLSTMHLRNPRIFNLISGAPSRLKQTFP